MTTRYIVQNILIKHDNITLCPAEQVNTLDIKNNIKYIFDLDSDCRIMISTTELPLEQLLYNLNAPLTTNMILEDNISCGPWSE